MKVLDICFKYIIFNLNYPVQSKKFKFLYKIIFITYILNTIETVSLIQQLNQNSKKKSNVNENINVSDYNENMSIDTTESNSINLPDTIGGQ